MWERPQCRGDHRDAKVPSTLLFFRSQQWKQDYVADGLCTSEQHYESIHPDADAAGGRHAMLEREKKFLVDFLLLFACLIEQTLPLHQRVI